MEPCRHEFSLTEDERGVPMRTLPNDDLDEFGQGSSGSRMDVFFLEAKTLPLLQ